MELDFCLELQFRSEVSKITDFSTRIRLPGI